MSSQREGRGLDRGCCDDCQQSPQVPHDEAKGRLIDIVQNAAIDSPCNADLQFLAFAIFCQGIGYDFGKIDKAAADDEINEVAQNMCIDLSTILPYRVPQLSLFALTAVLGRIDPAVDLQANAFVADAGGMEADEAVFDQWRCHLNRCATGRG